MLAWFKRHLGVQIIDFSLSVWWQWQPKLSPSELTKAGHIPVELLLARKTGMLGFTIGPWFLSLDRNNDSAWMVCPKDMRWLSNFSWFWGAGRGAGGGYMEDEPRPLTPIDEWDDDEPTLVTSPLGKPKVRGRFNSLVDSDGTYTEDDQGNWHEVKNAPIYGRH